MKVSIFPSRPGVHTGNILWKDKFSITGGLFPEGHPVGGGCGDAPDGQNGDSENIKEFRLRGYWASCFPEGDGITWKPLAGQDDERCLKDIGECFPDWEE